MSNPTAVPGARATLLLSLAMSIIGITGVFRSYGALTISPDEIEQSQVPIGDPQAQIELLTAMSRSPVMQGFEVANLLASGLLIVGSLLLTARRRSAIWWTTQALIANLLYTAARVGGTIWFGQSHPDLVGAFFEAVEGQPPLPPSAQLVAFAAGESCGALVVVVIYAVMMRVSRREDVRSFVSREKPG